MLCYGSPLSTASQYGPSRYCVYCSIAWKPRIMVLVLEVLACFRWHQLQSWLFSLFLCEVMWALHCWCLVLRTKICSAFMREPEICESLGIQFRVSKLPRFMKRGVISCFFLLWIFHPMRWGPVFFRVRPVFWIYVSESAVLLPKPLA